jgi:hypothetical protein
MAVVKLLLDAVVKLRLARRARRCLRGTRMA